METRIEHLFAVVIVEILILDEFLYIKELAVRGAKVLASNSDPHNVDENDNFFDDLYSGLNINRVSANRAINSKGKDRGKIYELLISGF